MNLPNNKKLNNENGFGLTENILSASLLIFLVTFSMYFISLRQRTTYNTNLTNAINDEIYRDIEIIKSELKNYKVNSSQNENISIIRNNHEDCNEDILSAIRNLNSWYPEIWNPGSDKLTREGQIRNKIFTGGNIEIRRIAKRGNPLLNNINDAQIDSSIVNVQYSVRFNKSNSLWKIWTNVILSNELNSYCPPI